MATSGTITNTFRTGYAIRITWNVTSQSVANNTSAVSVNVQLVSLGSSYTINSSATKNGSVTINGTKYTFTFSAALSGNQTKTIHTRTVTIPHNSDGSKTCSFSCAAGIAVTLSGTYYSSVQASGSGVFNNIARATTPTLSASSINLGENLTINTPRAASNFTHTLTYSFGGTSGTIASSVATSHAWTVPLSLANRIPSATSGTGTITCQTYNGSTLLGTKSVSFTAKVPSSVVPSISSVTLSEATAGIAAKFGFYVQNKSKLRVVTASTGAYSSTIQTVKTVIQGKTYTGASIDSDILTASGNITASITVTDSRGRTATTTRTVSVTAYTSPKINTLQGFRATTGGAEDYEGVNIRITSNFAITSLSSKNNNSYRFEYKLQTATTWSTLSTGNSYAYNTGFTTGALFGQDSAFDIRLTITDFFGSISKTIEIPTAFTLVDYNRSGRAVAFGKVSELAEGIEFGIPAYFSNGETPTSSTYLTVGTDLDNLKTAGFYVISNASVSRSLLHKPYTSEATGNIIVLNAGDSGQLSQICIKGSKGSAAGVWERQFYLDSWGGWNCISNGGGRILWSGGMYMTAGHTAPLSERVSEQPNGIELVFCRYSGGTVQNYHFNHFFVHKEFVANHAGAGSQFFMTTDGTLSVIASKYLYIHDDRITGNAINNQTGTSNGITYANNGFVLRYVLGV